MKINNMEDLKRELSKIGSVNLLNNGNEKDRINFFIKLSKVMGDASNLKYSDDAMLEIALILRSKGIVRLHNYYKANNIRPSKSIFDAIEARTSEFPVVLFSTIAYGTEEEAKSCMNAFRGRDNMMSRWTNANKFNLGFSK